MVKYRYIVSDENLPVEQDEKQAFMYSVIEEVMQKTALPPTHPQAKRTIVKKFMDEYSCTRQTAYKYLADCSMSINPVLPMGSLVNHVIHENLRNQQQLQELIDDIQSGDIIGGKDPAANISRAIAYKNDAQKVLCEFIYKHLRQEEDTRRNDILDKKTEMENAANIFNVALQLEGSLEEKLEEAHLRLSKHADLIEASFSEIKDDKANT